MCGPAAVIPLLIASTAITAAGSVYSGITQSHQAAYQAKIADANQRQANAAANDALDRGVIAARDQARRNAQIGGAQRAAAAANGIDVDFGSSFQMQGDTAMLGAQDLSTIRQNAARESRSYSIQGANFGAQAAADRFTQSTIPVATAFSLGSTILGGATQIGGYNAKMSGPSASMGFMGPI